MTTGALGKVTARWRLILAVMALSAAGVYVYWDAPVRTPAVSPTQATAPDPTTRSAALPVLADAEAALPERSQDSVDLFAPRNWEPPPPPVPVAAVTPPPPPQAPPLPFKFFGRIADPDQAPSFILIRGKEMLTVRVGDRIEPSYRVDKFDGTKLQLLYLPLNVRQSIFVGNANE